MGVVLTPSAVYQGRVAGVGLAWQLDQLEVDLIENPTVNRGKDGYITGQDAAMTAFDVLCPVEGEEVGQFCPVSYTEEEQRGLVVSKCVFKCLALPENPKLVQINGADRTWRFSADSLDAAALSANGVVLSDVVSVECGPGVQSIGDLAFLSCPSIEHLSFQGESIGTAAFRSCSSLTAVSFGPALTSIGDRAFCFDAAMTSAFFDGQPPVTGERGFYGCWDLSAFVLSGSEAWDEWSTANDIPVVPR